MCIKVNRSTLIQSVVIITLLFLISLVKFGDADAQEQNITNATSTLMEKGGALLGLRQYREDYWIFR